MLLAPGHCVLLANKLTAGGRVMARCLAEVVSRIPEGILVAYLDPVQEHEPCNKRTMDLSQTMLVLQRHKHPTQDRKSSGISRQRGKDGK